MNIMDFAQALYLTDIMHLTTQALLVPVIVLLLAFMCYALFEIGSIVVETVAERRNFKVKMPVFLSALVASDERQLPDVIAASGLLKRQKAALLTLWTYRTLPPEAHVALAKRLLATEDMRFRKIVGRTDAVARVAPMVGLMGTLIPLGPGIVALGQGDTQTLAESIGVAFDTTVAGLAAAAVAFVVSKLRKNWYEDYTTALESALSTVIEKVDGMRERGEIDEAGTAEDLDEILANHRASLAGKDEGSPAAEVAGEQTPQPEGGR